LVITDTSSSRVAMSSIRANRLDPAMEERSSARGREILAQHPDGAV
jgi:hypothetical protein